MTFKTFELFYTALGNEIYRYRAGTFSGVRTYSGVTTGGLRICSVYACLNDTLESCGIRYPQYSPNRTGVFETLEILAAVPVPQTNTDLSAKEAAYFPISLDTALMPLNPADYIFQENNILNATYIYTFTLRKFNVELYSFAVWGREYSLDGQEVSNNGNTTDPPSTEEPDSSVTHKINIILLFISFVIILQQ